ncbi:hypothetical protein BDZ89DRAFT_1037169 [Hymenopellis radicata]|nr:hypothetical protein BDZ89DRAFT_1037169 [Hymenopellis radicata]
MSFGRQDVARLEAKLSVKSLLRFVNVPNLEVKPGKHEREHSDIDASGLGRYLKFVALVSMSYIYRVPSPSQDESAAEFSPARQETPSAARQQLTTTPFGPDEDLDLLELTRHQRPRTRGTNLASQLSRQIPRSLTCRSNLHSSSAQNSLSTPQRANGYTCVTVRRLLLAEEAAEVALGPKLNHQSDATLLVQERRATSPHLENDGRSRPRQVRLAGIRAATEDDACVEVDSGLQRRRIVGGCQTGWNAFASGPVAHSVEKLVPIPVTTLNLIRLCAHICICMRMFHGFDIDELLVLFGCRQGNENGAPCALDEFR